MVYVFLGLVAVGQPFKGGGVTGLVVVVVLCSLFVFPTDALAVTCNHG